MATPVERTQDLLAALFDKPVAPPKAIDFAEEFAGKVGDNASDNDIAIAFLDKVERLLTNGLITNAEQRKRIEAQDEIRSYGQQVAADKRP